MALTYTAIATVTVGSGGAADIEFTSIPGTYTDLLIKLSSRVASGSVDNLKMNFNGNTSSYSYREVSGNGSSASSSSGNTSTIGLVNSDATASTFTNDEIYIPNYAGSNNKSYSNNTVTENNGTLAYAALFAGLWSNSAAITSIKLARTGTGNFAQYSTATLYGIKNTV